MGGGGGGGGYDEGPPPAAPPSGGGFAKKVGMGLRQGLMDAMNAESAGKAAFRKVVEEVAPCFDSGPLLVMEEILEKLKMLDYEDHFKSFRPLTHTYFAMASANPNEQFYYFTSLVEWLLSLLGQSWKAPSQLDDPNSAVASMYEMLKQIGAPTNFGAMKLKSGCGEAVCSVLKQYAIQGSNDRLADATDRPATHAFEPHLGQSARPHPDRVPPARLRRGGCL